LSLSREKKYIYKRKDTGYAIDYANRIC
jgi:hypothetical protein